MKPVLVRRAEQADSHILLDLVERLVEFGPPPWRDAGAMRRIDRQNLEKAIASTAQDPSVLVAWSGSDIAGFIHLHSALDAYNECPHGHISDIVVASEFEGRGVAQSLMDAAEDWARAQGYAWLTLNVFEDNARALKAYERRGFQRDILRMVRPL